jgi:hypothetical protein
MSDEDTETTEEAVEETTDGEDQKDSKTWFPYVTKSQFDKFLSRLQTKMPDEIDRDYIRAMIRTPSMIYRFLRGIEAMKLIDRDQKPTDRLRSLVAPESRKQAINEILKDLYPELLDQYQQSQESMADRDIVSFFRRETGMGSDSANKMKMFFKYLLSEADPDASSSDGQAEEEEADSEVEETTTTPARPARDLRAAQRKSPPRPPVEPPVEPPANSAATPGEQRSFGSRPLSEAQKAYLDTVKSVLKINIDGDWDDDMLKLAFDRLERLFDRLRRG